MITESHSTQRLLVMSLAGKAVDVNANEKGVMNMAKNPFYQLDVIRDVSQNGKKITDCYRLMYNKELWIKAYAKLYPNAGNL